MESIACLLFFLSFSFLLLSAPTVADSTASDAGSGGGAPIPSGMIQRITKQQILATIHPGAPESAQPFLTSPSGKYTAFLLRSVTAPQAGGFGNDFCYIQIQDTAAAAAGGGDGVSVWESRCEPLSSANACSLVFDDNGLEVFDGSHKVWDSSAGVDNNYPAMLEIVDGGDMRVIDKDGELVWRASDRPLANQRCGLPGSPGLNPESPPFSRPVGGDQNPPFGQNQLPSQTSAVNTQLTNGGLNQEQQQSPLPVAAPPTSVTDGEQQPTDAPEQQPPVVAAPPTSAADEEYGQEPPLPAVAATPSEAPIQQQQQPLLQGLSGNGVSTQASSGIIGAQPLVDNNPYDSGSTRKEAWAGFGMASLLSLLLLLLL